MRNFTAFFLLLLLLNSCRYSVDSDTVEEDAAKEDAVLENEMKADSITIRDQQFFQDLFIGGRPTVESLREEFDDFRVVEENKVENRHVAGQTDTTYVIEAGGSQFEIYYVNGESMIQSAIIRSREITLNKNISTGIHLYEFTRSFPQIQTPLSDNATVTVEGEVVPESAKFIFNNGVLQEIHYQGYVD